MNTAAQPGDTTEILPAFSMETGARTEWDEVAGSSCYVVRFTPSGADAVVEINGREEVVSRSRLAVVTRL
jgi:hypothetical protein